ncbi:MAG: M20/M25/M40 family metallo-hydrolase [Oscillospiraceae bacterium]|jgi:endoglucanase|nr:M20/M25/M40 family metallo-hydrolase [Oscillospiraceae bacterium]
MDYESLLREWVRADGLSGAEAGVSRVIADAFMPYCDSVTTDTLQNVIARLKQKPGAENGPLIIALAHQDEIGLMTTLVEKDGAIRFTRVGGADPRTLPGSRVWVHAEGAQPLAGVIGALPPHLLTAADRKKHYKMDDLFIDVGLPYEEVAARVPTGTLVSLNGDPVKLQNNKIASKTLDDRLCVAVMLRAAELLSRVDLPARVAFVASSQEEVGSRGAQTSAYALDPDIGIALDVAQGKQGAKDDADYLPLDQVSVGIGTVLHPELSKLIVDTAKEQRVSIGREYIASYTSTDADNIQGSRFGVPTALIGVPVANMHTPVELASLDTVEEAARLLAAVIEKMARKWADSKGADWLCQWPD